MLVPRKTSSRHGGESQNQTDLVSTAALATESFCTLPFNTQANTLFFNGQPVRLIVLFVGTSYYSNTCGSPV